MQINKDKILIGVISDTHLPSRGSEIPQQIIKDFKDKNVDYIFHLGDFTTLETYNSLIENFDKDKIIAISGNMDNREINEKLPTEKELEILGHKIFLTHGSGGPYRIIERLNKSYNLSKYDIILFGHTHHPFKEERDGKLYLNPGTPTDKKFTDVNSYAFLEISKNKVNFEIKYI